MSNPYTTGLPYAQRTSFAGLDLGGTLNAALNQQKGVDGQVFYSTDHRRLLAWDDTTYQMWTAIDGAMLYQAAPVWVTGTAYTVGQYVTNGTSTYICLVAHTSGTFATDLAAADWVLANMNTCLFDDFRAGTIDSRYSIYNGGGTAAASPACTAGVAAGECTLVTGTANGVTACSSLTVANAWTPNVVAPWKKVGATAAAGAGTFKQKLTFVCKAKVSNITSGSFFLGFTDVLATSTATSQTPLTLTTATLAISTTNTGVSNCVGFLFDTGATTKHVWCVSSNAGSVTTPVDSATLGPAIAAATYLMFMVTVDTSGNATFYMAPVPTAGNSPVWVTVGSISAAVAATANLSPCAVVASRSATSVTLTLDTWGAL